MSFKPHKYITVLLVVMQFSKYFSNLSTVRLNCKLDKTSSNSSLEECKHAIRDSVSMTWRSNDRDHHGIVNTEKLEWSDTELDKLRKRPFSLTGETQATCDQHS